MSKTDPMWVFENYAGAAELIDELESELSDTQHLLAERDAEIERLKSAPCECGAPVGYVSGEKYEAAQQRIRDYRKRIAALEAQQAASVGGEREAFEAAYSGEYGTPVSVLMLLRDGERYIGKANHTDRLNSSWWMWQKRAALSPAGGGHQELAPEDELNVALVLSHAQDLRLQGHTERADALVQAAEEYVAILAEVQAAQRGMRFRAGEL